VTPAGRTTRSRKRTFPLKLIQSFCFKLVKNNKLLISNMTAVKKKALDNN